MALPFGIGKEKTAYVPVHRGAVVYASVKQLDSQSGASGERFLAFK